MFGELPKEMRADNSPFRSPPRCGKLPARHRVSGRQLILGVFEPKDHYE